MSARLGATQWRLHLVLLGGLSLCAFGFLVELKRGMGGILPAWAYVFEWPVFGVVGLVMWWRLLHESADGDPTSQQALPAQPAETLDVELAAWNSYVARLQADKPEH
jgi:hypothetical protein